MSKTNVQHSEDKAKGTKLPAVFSNIKPNIHLLHLSVLRQLNNARAGTASTKTKAEVRGGGKKPWKQKGTGRARAGSSRSPLWVGGGVIFGPKPRDFKTNLPKKERNIAIAHALASKKDNTEILKKLPEIKDYKTKNLLQSLKSFGVDKQPTLLIYNTKELQSDHLIKASSNVPYLEVKNSNMVGVFDILRAQKILISEPAIVELEERFSKYLSNKKSDKAAK